jgi:hypothetical protein
VSVGKRLSADQLRELEAEGVAVQRQKPALPIMQQRRNQAATQKPAKDMAAAVDRGVQAINEGNEKLSIGLGNQTEAIAALAENLGRGNMMLADQLETVLRNNQQPGSEPIPYRFTVHRGRNNLIDYIDAVPIVGGD